MFFRFSYNFSAGIKRALGCRFLAHAMLLKKSWFGCWLSSCRLLVYRLERASEPNGSRERRCMQFKKKGRDFWFYAFALSLAFMRTSMAISKKVKPVMPLTSLGDNGMPDWFQVTSMASTNKIAANIRTSSPITTFSIFMNSHFSDIAL